MNSIKIEISKAWLERQPDEIVIRLDVEANSGTDKETEKAVTIQELLTERIADMKKTGRLRTAQTYESTLSSLSKYHPSDLPLSSLSEDMVRGYEQWMQKRGLTRNTSSFYLRRLRTVWRIAAERGLTAQGPLFARVFTGMERTRKRALPSQTLQRLMNVKGDNEREAFALDMFRFSLFSRGMSFVDMCFLRQSDIQNGVLTYQRRKTGQQIRIRWEPQLAEIAERYARKCDGYLLPLVKRGLGDERKQYMRSQHTQNNRLKAIGRKLNLAEPLTMYVARHSWASTAKRMNVPLNVISDSMGHTSARTTQIYLAQIDPGTIDETNAQIIRYLERRDEG